MSARRDATRSLSNAPPSVSHYRFEHLTLQQTDMPTSMLFDPHHIPQVKRQGTRAHLVRLPAPAYHLRCLVGSQTELMGATFALLSLRSINHERRKSIFLMCAQMKQPLKMKRYKQLGSRIPSTNRWGFPDTIQAKRRQVGSVTCIVHQLRTTRTQTVVLG